ncbi:hypothetical protein K504DRAFT_458915 [Pleomassaria siparia CBS 279.74]|uniref:Uncharacterized protein n=1 Tax=Pleomassaria siparia CBS 279.74 TaxID=1314801 RepID=A0A6G1K1X0_9PLEO|nr:hypothetical protein K504DRAFT_458915 [Pleomassaria siparia CBS 279.74]
MAPHVLLPGLPRGITRLKSLFLVAAAVTFDVVPETRNWRPRVFVHRRPRMTRLTQYVVSKQHPLLN